MRLVTFATPRNVSSTLSTVNLMVRFYACLTRSSGSLSWVG